MLSYQAMGLSQAGQNERGRTTERSLGNRKTQTLRKLTMSRPRSAASVVSIIREPLHTRAVCPSPSLQPKIDVRLFPSHVGPSRPQTRDCPTTGARRPPVHPDSPANPPAALYVRARRSRASRPRGWRSPELERPWPPARLTPAPPCRSHTRTRRP